MKPITEYRCLLPKAAKAFLIEFFFARLESSKLDYLYKTRYTSYEAEKESEVLELPWHYVKECYETALAQWERKHPLKWDEETKKVYR